MRAFYSLVAWLALLLGAVMVSGCSGTRAAYSAADGLSETAYVLGEHYYVLVREANALADSRQLSYEGLIKIQELALETRPTIVTMLNTARAYELVESAETELELSAAITSAALAVSQLIDAIKEARGTSQLSRPPGTAPLAAHSILERSSP